MKNTKNNKNNKTNTKESVCEICKEPLDVEHGAFMGNGDGTGQRFVHCKCVDILKYRS